MSVNTCVILCGGKSSRLRGANGEIKAILPFGNKSLIAYNVTKMRSIFKCVFIACKAEHRDLIDFSLRDAKNAEVISRICKRSKITIQDYCHTEYSKVSNNWELGRDSSLYTSTKNGKILDCHVKPLYSSHNDKNNPQHNIFIVESTDIFAPIVGIISAFMHIKSDKIFFISCDCPFVSIKTIETLCKNSQNYDIVFAKDTKRTHPLVAVWSVKTLDILQDMLKNGDFRLQNAFDRVQTKALLCDGDEFLNINTISDYENAIKKLGIQNGRF